MFQVCNQNQYFSRTCQLTNENKNQSVIVRMVHNTYLPSYYLLIQSTSKCIFDLVWWFQSEVGIWRCGPSSPLLSDIERCCWPPTCVWARASSFGAGPWIYTANRVWKRRDSKAKAWVWFGSVERYFTNKRFQKVKRFTKWIQFRTKSNQIKSLCFLMFFLSHPFPGFWCLLSLLLMRAIY